MYESVREAIKLLQKMDKEWFITELSAECALKALDDYERREYPAPKIFVESEGVTFKWEVEKWSIYQHFPCDTTESECYFFWRKS